VARPGLEDEARITSESGFAASPNPALVDRDMDSSDPLSDEHQKRLTRNGPSPIQDG
jgi:hypothetical protein